MSSSVIQLECQCNNYPWGKRGQESLAAQFAASTPGGNFKLDESKEYAEVDLLALLGHSTSESFFINFIW
jgi:mannose-6-phosphate isomerase class I